MGRVALGFKTPLGAREQARPACGPTRGGPAATGSSLGANCGAPGSLVSASARVPLLDHLLPQKGFPLCSCVSCLCPSMCACHLHTCAHTCAQGEMHTHAPYCVLPPGTCAPTFTSTHTAPGHGGMLSLGPVWASPDPGWGRGSLLASWGCVPQHPARCTGPLPCLVCPSTCPSGAPVTARKLLLSALLPPPPPAHTCLRLSPLLTRGSVSPSGWSPSQGTC